MAISPSHKLILDHLQEQSARLLSPESDVWAMHPVKLDEFIDVHLRLPPLTTRQYQELITLLGPDPEKIFDYGSPYNVMCQLAGKGSGKDHMAAIISCYIMYILLCMRNPQKYFNLSPGSSIDIVVVSYSQPQVLYNTYDKIKTGLKGWYWLRNHYALVIGDQLIGTRGKPDIRVLSTMVCTYNNIRILPMHSQSESYEGYNIVYFIMSESCLRGRSLITLDDNSKISIADIVNNKRAIRVLSRNMITGQIESRKVVAWFKYPRRSPFVQIRVGDSNLWNTAIQTLQCTPNHHMFVERGYIRADQLCIGDKAWVGGKFCSLLEVKSIEFIDSPWIRYRKSLRMVRYNRDIVKDDNFVYDIEVEGNHNYFAGDVLVSNSAFKSHTEERNGNKVYATLRSSAQTRFGRRWKGIVASFPRYTEEHDFTWLLYQERLKDASIYGTIGSTWDYRPSLFSGHMLDYEGLRIPVELKEDFEGDLDGSKRKFMCIPGKGGEQVFKTDLIVKSVVIGKSPVFTLSQYVDGSNIKAKIHELGIRSVGSWGEILIHDYLLTVDLGKTNSACAIALQHIQEGQYTLDAIGAWTPDPNQGLIVDFIDVKARLIEIMKLIPNLRIWFDQWQSELFQAELREYGVQSGTYHTYDHDYSTFMKGLALGKALLLDYKPLLTQLNALREWEGKIYLDKGMSIRKDLVDVVVGGFKLLMSEERKTDLPGYIIGNNLSQFGTVIG